MRCSRFNHLSKSLFFGLLALLIISENTFAEAYQKFETTGQYVQNHDGDTFRIQTADHSIVTVRFAGSDTPETGQAYWKVARDELRSLLTSKEITISCYKKNRDRDVCRVFTNDGDVGLAMISRGVAWYAFQFAHEQTTKERQDYAAAERDARSRKLGLWIEPDPMPPWECRALRRKGQKCR
jgi:endonuclease YncB( thermonuclease family)